MRLNRYRCALLIEAVRMNDRGVRTVRNQSELRAVRLRQLRFDRQLDVIRRAGRHFFIMA